MFPIRDDQPRSTQPLVTWFLISLNAFIFLFEATLPARALREMVFQFGLVPAQVTGLFGADAFSPGAAFLPLFTSMFLHGSWLHLIGNMWILWIYGDNIEDYLGHFAYLVFYLACGVVAAGLHVLFNLGSTVPTVGASGAIAGVMGAYFVLYPRATVLTFIPPIFFFPMPSWVMLGYWFVVQFLSGTATSIGDPRQMPGGVAFWAHVGGFLAGIAMIRIFPQRRRRYATW
jgi:membrane associated rhomboid family serine protease